MLSEPDATASVELLLLVVASSIDILRKAIVAEQMYGGDQFTRTK